MDVVVVGGGIAGVSAAYELAVGATVTLLEQEAQLSHHTTGRSAATYLETYGSPTVRRLTLASRPFFESPPVELDAAGAAVPARAAVDRTRAERGGVGGMADTGRALVPTVRFVQGDEVLELVSCVAARVHDRGVFEPDAMDIDVAALHQAYVRGVRQRGGEIVRSSPSDPTARRRRRLGRRHPTSTSCVADVVVNAAGAWADEVAAMAGVADRSACSRCDEPRSRVPRPTVSTCAAGRWWRTSTSASTSSPRARNCSCSLADETPSPPCDAQTRGGRRGARHRAHQRGDHARPAPRPSRLGRPAVASSPIAPRSSAWIPTCAGFCWLAGQGGYGIQTAPGDGPCATAGLVLERAFTRRSAGDGRSTKPTCPRARYAR